MSVTAPAPSSASRLRSVDALRGFAMFMITGGGLILFALGAFLPKRWAQGLNVQLNHSAWEGCTFLDCIFPLFLFLAGLAFSFSWERQCARAVRAFVRWRRLLFRTLTLILLGVLYNELSRGSAGVLSRGWEDVRWFSVLGRIGLSLFLAAIPYALLKPTYRWLFFPVGLVGYGALLFVLGGEAAFQQTALSRFWTLSYDRWLVPHATVADPEGVISALGALFTAYAGMCIGERMRDPPKRCMCLLFLLGAGALSVGLLASQVMPILKFLWTPTYVLVTTGIACLLLMAVYGLLDVLNVSRGTTFFTFIGAHSLCFYFMPWLIDFNGVGWKVVGGAFRLCEVSQALQVLCYYSLGYGLLWGTLYLLLRGVQGMRLRNER